MLSGRGVERVFEGRPICRNRRKRICLRREGRHEHLHDERLLLFGCSRRERGGSRRSARLSFASRNRSSIFSPNLKGKRREDDIDEHCVRDPRRHRRVDFGVLFRIDAQDEVRRRRKRRAGTSDADDDGADRARLERHLDDILDFARVREAERDVTRPQRTRRHPLKVGVDVGHDRNSKTHQLVLRLDGQDARRPCPVAVDAGRRVEHVDGLHQRGEIDRLPQ